MSAFTPEAARAIDGPDWLIARRVEAAERFASAAPPTPEEEVWRYSRIDKLDLDAYRPPASSPAAPSALPLDVAATLTSIGERSALAITLDGHLVSTEDTDDVFTAATPDDAVAVTAPHDALSHLHDAFLGDPLNVRVARNRHIERPIVIVHLTSGTSALAASHLSVDVGEAAEAMVIELFATLDPTGSSLAIPRTSLSLGQAANLKYAAVQTLGPADWSIAHQGGRVGRDATLTSLVVALGGNYARVRTDSLLDGQGGNANLLAVYFGDGNQMHDFRTMQDHRARNTTSDLLFKGAVAGTSHGVYSGLIRVQKGAKGTRAFQTNRNLVLSDGAGADSVPNLEIDENDLTCSHASAVGPVDEQQRFYLETRGIPTAVADRLITLGFLDDALARSPIPGLRQPIALSLAKRVEEATG